MTRGTGFALLAIAIPVFAGLAHLALFSAPRSYLLVNAGALVLGSVWIWFSNRIPALTRQQSWSVMIALLVMVALPLITGPHINDVSRWITLGPFQLHMGMIALPSLVVLAAMDRDNAPLVLCCAIFLFTLQPDAAASFAILGAATGLYFAWHDWKPGVVGMTAFAAGVYAALHGELPPQPFVERVLVNVANAEPLLALALLGALLIGFFLMLFSINRPPAVRYALAGSLAGFSITAVLSNYPSILIGYGAAPILGYALALGVQGEWDELSETD